MGAGLQPVLNISNFSPLESQDLLNLQKVRVIIHIVGNIFTVKPEHICSPLRKNARCALARQIAMYLVHIQCGLNYSQTGLLFGRDRTTVAHACAKVEDQRDDPLLDTVLAHSEKAALRLFSATAKKDFSAL